MGLILGVIIPPKGERIPFESTTETILADLYRVIETDMVERVTSEDGALSIWLDENGLLDSHFVINYPASQFADENGMPGHLFVGTAVVLGGTDDEGYEVGLTREEAVRILA